MTGVRMDYCAQCGTELEGKSGKCADYPDCEALGMTEWRAKVFGDGLDGDGVSSR